MSAIARSLSRLEMDTSATMATSATSGQQGQRTLTCSCSNHFHQELVGPAAGAAPHDQALPPVGVLLEDRQREAVQPGDVRAQYPLPDPRVVLAERHIEAP